MKGIGIGLVRRNDTQACGIDSPLAWRAFQQRDPGLFPETCGSHLLSPQSPEGIGCHGWGGPLLIPGPSHP